VEPYINCGDCVACRRGKPNCCVNLKVLGVHIDGGMRPLLCIPAGKLHSSSALDYDQLALVEMLAIGAHAVERAKLQAEDFILVIGAGPIGLSVVEFARDRARLAIMDINESRLGFCREKFGIEHIVRAGPQAAAQILGIGKGEMPTVVIDATGNPESMEGTFKLAAHGGRIVFVGLFPGEITFSDPEFHRRELTLCSSRNALPGTFREVITRVEAGRVDATSWITHRLGLGDVPTAFPSSIVGNPSLLKAIVEVRLQT